MSAAVMEGVDVKQSVAVADIEYDEELQEDGDGEALKLPV